MSDLSQSRPKLVSRNDFPVLFEILKGLGFELIGPTLRDRAIVYERLESVEDLPIGWTDEQEAGLYRVKRRADQALFGFNLGPDSWKKFLHAPVVSLWKARKTEQGLEFCSDKHEAPRRAFIGMRSCELHAIAVQDRVLNAGSFVDPHYVARRQAIFTVAVQCGQAARSCFCTSMGTGPEVRSGYDLVVTELLDSGNHRFLIESGSQEGADVLSGMPGCAPSLQDFEACGLALSETRKQITRKLEPEGIRELLYRNAESSHWERIAERCLACTNCTMVCPTCFCTAVEDVTQLEGNMAERTRRWDSCFNGNFSYLHGGNVRQSTASRYRQWMTHKLASWHDQFDTSGCVGCGRCISWCPVGIDITEEVAAIRASEFPGDSNGSNSPDEV